VDNNYLDLGMNKSGFVHTLPSGRLSFLPQGDWTKGRAWCSNQHQQFDAGGATAISERTTKGR
jgi:hypothetical protein